MLNTVQFPVHPFSTKYKRKSEHAHNDSPEDHEQLLKNVLLPQQLMATCLHLTQWGGPGGYLQLLEDVLLSQELLAHAYLVLGEWSLKDPKPDLLVRSIDPLIRVRIHAKRIRNTGSLNSCWQRAFLRNEQLLEDVVLSQELLATCLTWTRWMEPEGFWTAVWGCAAPLTAGSHVLTLDSLKGAWRILNSCLRTHCSPSSWWSRAYTLDSVNGAWRILNSCLRMYGSPNSWWSCAYLGLGGREPEGFWTAVWGCTAPPTAGGHMLTLDLVKGDWRILNSCLRMYCSPNSWWPCAYIWLNEGDLEDTHSCLRMFSSLKSC